MSACDSETPDGSQEPRRLAPATDFLAAWGNRLPCLMRSSTDDRRNRTRRGKLIPRDWDGQQLDWETVWYLSEAHERTLEANVRSGHSGPEVSKKPFHRDMWPIEKYKPGRSVKITAGKAAFHGATWGAPHRGRAYIQMLRILHNATGVWQRNFVIRVLGPLALWVLDLPASESYHHAYHYGLLDHSLEVALACLTECGLRIWPRDPSHCGDPALPGRVLRLSITLGLLHDIGKVCGVEVRDEKSGEIWDPLREPLAYFKVRKGIPLFSPTSYRFLNGRGLHDHEQHGRNLLQSLLPKRTWSQIGSPLGAAYDAYLERFDRNRITRPAPIDFIADIVQRADGESTNRAHKEGWSAESRFQELMEAAARVQWNRDESPAIPPVDDLRHTPDLEREPEATC